MQGLILLPGVFVTLLLLVLGLEYSPLLPKGRAARIVGESSAEGLKPTGGIQKTLHPFEGAVARFVRPQFLKRGAFDLYWAQQSGHWSGWTALQWITLRVIASILGLAVGLILLHSPLMAVGAGWVAGQAAASPVRAAARKTRRQFLSQLPEYIQLTTAQMAAGISLEEALKRTSRTESLPARWMRQVIQMSQGRSLLVQLQREAEESQLAELVSLGVQLGFIQRGTAQEQLMGQLSAQIAADSIGAAELRAEKIGAELVVPMVLFYFLPFLISLMTIIAWPIINGLL
jgi:Flp pilus assembly protein TadB